MWPPALKALIFSFLFLEYSFQGGFFWTLVFIAAAAYLYFQPFFEAKKFVYSFGIIVFYSLVAGGFLSANSFGDLAVWAAAVVFGAAFFIILGVKNFSFLRRDIWLNVLTGFLYFLASAVFFIADKNSGYNFIFYFIVSFLAFFGILKEFVDFSYLEFPRSKKNLIVAGSAFLAIELATAAALLPIGFLNASALMLLFIFISEDFISHHLKGNLNRQMILNNVTILIVAMIFIFATSKWTP